ncbi:hypothetical protein D3C72_866480 [compost metagenome]
MLHAAGELVGPAPGKTFEAHQGEDFIRRLVPFGLADATHFQAKRHVVAHRAPRKQCVLLEHHAALWRWTGDCGAIDVKRAGARLQVAGQGAEQGRFAATGRPENAHELPRFDLAVEALHGFEGRIALAQADRQSANIDTPFRVLKYAHQAFPRGRCQGVNNPPRRLISRLLPIPSTPISNMPTTMSG